MSIVFRNFNKEAEYNRASTYGRTMRLSYNKIQIQESMDSMYSPKSRAVSIKILLNYLQMIGIISSFDLKWPSSCVHLFSAQAGAGIISGQIFSIDCFKDSKLNY